MSFVHLHVHTHYSIMDAISQIRPLFERAKELGMPALAITDHSNMYGVKEFYDEAKKHPDIKPILGCEVNVTDHYDHSLKDVGHKKFFHLVLLAKNYQGYKNLMKIVSIGHTEGMYYGKPRISHEIIKKYSEGLICLSGCPGGEIPRAIAENNLDAADKAVRWYKDVFGEDFYLEVTLHKSEDCNDIYDIQIKVNEAIFQLAERHGVKVVASNDVHFIKEEESKAHDVFTCISTGKKIKDTNRLRYTGKEYLKSEQEMTVLFPEHPEVISNTLEVSDKVERFSIDKETEYPSVDIPDGYSSTADYFIELCLKGAKERYGELFDAIKKELEEECRLIIDKGWENYFLMVYELTSWCREKGIRLGPGRGAAAGSRVNYCLGITNLNPDAYGLLPCRFADSQQVYQPLIDLDIEDSSRGTVIRHITETYGSNHVARVISFGTFSAKKIATCVGDVLDLPKDEIDTLSIQVSREYCEKLQGCIYMEGTHACALTISKDELSSYTPLTVQKDKATGEETLVSQYDGKRVDDTGIMRMNLLGLNTLSVIDSTIKQISMNHGIDIDIDHIPLDDNKVYDLFKSGNTDNIFLYESEGMKKWLEKVTPDRFSDLIALNAMYRPGSMDYLPDFCAHKHNPDSFEYPVMEEVLGETYGIIVYQEQAMKLSQVIAGFSKSESNHLRKCIGKLRRAELELLKEKFIEGGMQNGYPKSSLKSIWEDMTHFGTYAFNKAHAACYTMIAYQCAWLKAHYTNEYESLYKEVYGD